MILFSDFFSLNEMLLELVNTEEEPTDFNDLTNNAATSLFATELFRGMKQDINNNNNERRVLEDDV